MNPPENQAREQEVIESVRRAREEEVRFFSSAAKGEHERWVAREFLTRLRVEFRDDEITSEPEGSPVDVTFRSANFQIKEVFDPAQQRHVELKESFRRAKQARTLRDLVAPVYLRDIVVTDLGNLLFDIAATHRYSPRVKADLDLLVYVTRPRAGFYESLRSVASKLNGLGWRSISCLLGENPLLLIATVASPPFLFPSEPKA
jgi:hypothetical protein